MHSRRKWTPAVLTVLAIVTAGLGGTNATAIHSPALAASTAVLHQIEIDGSPLFSQIFLVQGVTGWLDTRQVQTVNLEESKQYRIQTGTAAGYGTFWINSAGSIQYDQAAETYLDGANTRRLTLVGVQVTIDTRYLSNGGLLLTGSQEWIKFQTIRLLPQPYLYWQQGSGITVNFRTALQTDGTWSYDPRYDLSQGGYVAGNGTSTLTFYGYPLLVDARAAGGTGVLVVSVRGLEFTTSGVQTVILMPTARFYLLIRSGQVAGHAPFAMEDNGDITFDPSLPYRVDSFNGLRRLTVTGPL